MCETNQWCDIWLDVSIIKQLSVSSIDSARDHKGNIYRITYQLPSPQSRLKLCFSQLLYESFSALLEGTVCLSCLYILVVSYWWLTAPGFTSSRFVCFSCHWNRILSHERVRSLNCRSWKQPPPVFPAMGFEHMSIGLADVGVSDCATQGSWVVEMIVSTWYQHRKAVVRL